MANLAFIARQMAGFEESRAAADELMNHYVMPNLHFTKSVESTNACSWRQTVLTAANIYKSLGDHDKHRQCLDLIAEADERAGDQDMILYLLAFEEVRQERYTQAIATLAQIPADSKWANSREKLTNLWTQKQAEKQNSAQSATTP